MALRFISNTTIVREELDRRDLESGGLTGLSHTPRYCKNAAFAYTLEGCELTR
jgi:hypothetical protein